MPRKPFSIDDYIRIGSKDYVQEFSERVIWIGNYSLDLNFWRNLASGQERLDLKNFFLGAPFVVENNRLVVELPKEIAEDEEEKARMIDVAFGQNGKKEALVPLPTIVNRQKINIRVVPGSVSYTCSGRTVDFRFSTSISQSRKYPRLTKKELERGFFYDKKEFGTISVLQEFLLDPEGIDFCRTRGVDSYYGGYFDVGDHFVIKRSSDPEILRRKMMLELEWHLSPKVKALFDIMRIFDNQRVSGLTLPQQRSHYGYSSHARFRSKSRLNSYYSRMGNRDESSLAGYVRNLKADVKGFQECLDFVESVENSVNLDELDPKQRRKVLKGDRKFSANTGYGSIELFLYLCDLDSSDGFGELKDLLHAEVRCLTSIAAFVEEVLVPRVKRGEKVQSTICGYVYDKISLDPIMYSDKDADPFSDYARSLVL